MQFQAFVSNFLLLSESFIVPQYYVKDVFDMGEAGC